jgi:hypothetical protein
VLMLQTLVSGLLLATVTGMAVLAYRDFEVYKYLALRIGVISAGIGCLVLAFGIGADIVPTKAIGIIRIEQYEKLNAVVASLTEPCWWIAGITLGLAFYLAIVWFVFDNIQYSHRR